jgi:3-oxoacyl-[acyl-carrier protein] reductase
MLLAELGSSVAINYSKSRSEAEAVCAEIAALGGQAIAVQCDVADDGACRAMVAAAVERFGRLDILVNNAGVTEFIAHRDLESVTDATWDRILGVNLKGPFQCVRAAVPHMRKTGAGVIVNVSSIAGIAAFGSSIPYCASKAALINMTVSMARALGPEIRVNCVAPGFIEGEWLKQGLGPAYDAVKSAFEAKAVLGKVCTPSDVADAIMAFITGPSLVTGQTMTIDGGFLIGPQM